MASAVITDPIVNSASQCLDKVTAALCYHSTISPLHMFQHDTAQYRISRKIFSLVMGFAYGLMILGSVRQLNITSGITIAQHAHHQKRRTHVRNLELSALNTNGILIVFTPL